MPTASSPATPVDPVLAEEIRTKAGLKAGEGPAADGVQAAINVFVQQFDFWYLKQWDTILKKYVERIVRRVNPFVRRGQHGDCTADELATALIADWDSRNFVTAGGQALEALAIAAGPNCQKSIAEGVDVQRVDPADRSALHLYVLKSGSVTRNTDIVSKMKVNLRKAERLAKQNPGIKTLRLNYATCVGTLNSTLADGVERPSSARFWSEVLEVDEARAIKLIWTIAEEGARRITFPDLNRKALAAQVAAYVEKDEGGAVDWEFLVRVVTQPPSSYKSDHQRRDKVARARGEAILSRKPVAVSSG